ncbi:hypothetical protein PA598K_04067 [Paenibacillus sp. 598K]|uniref:hypothetical protein n=1 Tax=Paenibacillus sp. 598K TaxID=1117987 RepID=UPI000FFA2FFB|nr:hypothetical protein [Paenibacillus sp. 598K]GBF75646.1 hypothetical protein PA598K_04067 [Paenibacillus sp. 598K]
MNEKVIRYYRLKQRIRQMEEEAAGLRSEILAFCAAEGVMEMEAGGCRVRVVQQDRKEYDDERLYKALPDAKVWRMLSKADPAKVASLVKLNVLKEEGLADTYTVKRISLLQVDKK